MSFSDLNSASRTREVVKKIAAKVVNDMRPPDRVGRVYDIQPGIQTAFILFPGETEENVVKVRAALNMIPQKSVIANGTSNADIVRVSGSPGNYWISDFVQGGPASSGGGGGGGESGITFNFATAVDPWVMVHNFGVNQVLVQAYDPEGNAIDGDVTYVDENTVQIDWFAPVSGSCRVSR